MKNKDQTIKKKIDLKRLSPLLLVFVFFIVYKFIFNKHLDLNGDNFDYINLAKSILEGHGYRSPYTPAYLPANHYPPGYSVLLAITMFFVGKNMVILKILNGLFFIGSILLLNLTFDKITNNKILAFSVSIILILNSGLLGWSTILMSEIPYLFFSSLGFYFIVKFYEKGPLHFWKSKNYYFIILTLITTYYFRSIGIALLGAFLIFSLLKGKWKSSLGVLAGFTLLYLPWIIRNKVLGLKGRYMHAVLAVNNWRPEEGQINSVGQFIDKMLVNFYDTVIKGFSEVLFPFVNWNGQTKSLIMIVGSIILLLTLFGALRMKKYRFFILFYILGNIFVFLMWHSGNGSRYVWPLAPFIAYCFFYGLIEIISLITNNSTLVKRISFATLFIGLFFIPKLKELNEKASYGYPAAYSNYFNLAKSIKKANNKKLMICCRKPGMFHYFSETYVCGFANSLDDKVLINGLIKSNVDYVILDQLGYSSTARYLYPAIQKNQALFKVVSKTKKPETYILQFDKDKSKQKLETPVDTKQK
jgi:hypothetical protein